MAKIIGNTTATPNPRPDWNQVDATKADYIKNKPTILTKTEILNLIAVSGGGSGGSNVLIVSYDKSMDHASYDATDIYNHVSAGGTAVLMLNDNEYVSLTRCTDTNAYFMYVGEDRFVYIYDVLDDSTINTYKYALGGGGSGGSDCIIVRFVDQDEDRATYSSQQIYQHVSKGGDVIFIDGNNVIYNLVGCSESSAYFYYIDDEGRIYNIEICEYNAYSVDKGVFATDIPDFGSIVLSGLESIMDKGDGITVKTLNVYPMSDEATSNGICVYCENLKENSNDGTETEVLEFWGIGGDEHTILRHLADGVQDNDAATVRQLNTVRDMVGGVGSSLNSVQTGLSVMNDRMDALDAEVLKFTAQELTEEQKAQARENIGAGTEGGGIAPDYGDNLLPIEKFADKYEIVGTMVATNDRGMFVLNGQCGHLGGGSTTIKLFDAEQSGKSVVLKAGQAYYLYVNAFSYVFDTWTFTPRMTLGFADGSSKSTDGDFPYVQYTPDVDKEITNISLVVTNGLGMIGTEETKMFTYSDYVFAMCVSTSYDATYCGQVDRPVLCGKQMLTDTQKAQARANIDAASTYIIRATRVDGVWTIKETWKQLQDIVSAGTTLLFSNGDTVYYLHDEPSGDFDFLSFVQQMGVSYDCFYLYSDTSVGQPPLIDRYYEYPEIVINGDKWDGLDYSEIDFTDTINGMIDIKLGNVAAGDHGNMLSIDVLNDTYEAGGITITHDGCGVLTVNGTVTEKVEIDLIPKGTAFATTTALTHYILGANVLGGEFGGNFQLLLHTLRDDGDENTYEVNIYQLENKKELYSGWSQQLVGLSIRLPIVGAEYKDCKIAPYFGTGYTPDYAGRTKGVKADVLEVVNQQIGDISSALDELHTYAQALVNGGGAE